MAPSVRTPSPTYLEGIQEELDVQDAPRFTVAGRARRRASENDRSPSPTVSTHSPE